MDFRLFYFTTFVLIIFFCSCQNNTNQSINKHTKYIDSLHEIRKKQSFELVNNHIVDPEEFSGLRHFEPNLDYIIKADVNYIEPKEVVFKTNTQRSPTYYQIAVIKFTIRDTVCQLTLYASSADGKNDLFLPFKDLSNGKSTYGAGRYIEYPSDNMIKNNQMTIDFNQAFNPYCHYNINYSCPIVPIENMLNVYIHAGEKSIHD
jgi:uncharacterized protein